MIPRLARLVRVWYPLGTRHGAHAQFKELLKAAGANVSRISDMVSLFAEADKDGSGTLTIDEIKTLGDRNRNKVSPG